MGCKHYENILTTKDRHFINSEEHNNCVCCLAENEGPMTQEEIGNYMGLTKMRISQIEKQAKEKLRKWPGFLDTPFRHTGKRNLVLCKYCS